MHGLKLLLWNFPNGLGAVDGSIWCSKKQNVAQNVACVWQTNGTTQHRRFFAATWMQQNEHEHRHATSCNIGGKRVQHLMQHRVPLWSITG